MIHSNVVPTGYHIDHISQGVCKTVRTTFQCIVVLQLRGEGPENLSRICPIVMCLFRTFSPRLENNDTSKFSSDSFAHTLRYVVNVENCRNYIAMYQCPPIAGRRSKIALKFGGLRISECSITGNLQPHGSPCGQREHPRSREAQPKHSLHNSSSPDFYTPGQQHCRRNSFHPSV